MRLSFLASAFPCLLFFANASQASVLAPAVPAEDIHQPGPASGWLGMAIAKDAGEAILIQQVFEPSPAHAAGLKAGDRILAIEEVPTQDMSLEEAVTRLRGQAGTWVTLSILSDDDQIDLCIKRALPTPPI